MPSVESQGIRIVFDDLGKGVPVVLTHSFLCSGEMWAPVLPALAARARVVNVDLRGHGRSAPSPRSFTLYDMVGDVLAVLDSLGIERAVWAGLSIGGMISLRAALTVPNRVAGLVLLDTDAGPEHPKVRLKYRAMGLGAHLVGLRPFVPSVLPLMFGSTTLTTRPELVAEWRVRFAAVHVPSMLATLGALVRRDDLRPRLGEIRTPAMVLVGDEDTTLPPARASQIHAGIFGSRLEVIPRAGHLSALEQPDAVSDAILSFLETYS